MKNEIIDFFMYRFVEDIEQVTEHDRHIFVSGGICALLILFIIMLLCVAIWPSISSYTVIR